MEGEWGTSRQLRQEGAVASHLGLAAAEGCAKVAAQGYESSNGWAIREEVQRLQAHAHLRVHPHVAAGALGPGVEVQDPCAVLLGRRSLSSLTTCSSSSSKFSFSTACTASGLQAQVHIRGHACMATATPDPKGNVHNLCASFLGWCSFTCCPTWHQHIKLHSRPLPRR